MCSRSADRSGLIVGVWSCRSTVTVVLILVIIIIVTIRFVLTTPHSDITSDTNSTTLFGNHATQCSALSETRELLCAKDGEGNRLDLESMGDVCALLNLSVLWCLAIHIFVLLQFFI